jgi:hypothetical protein
VSSSGVAAPEVVRPAHLSHPEFDTTLGPLVADLSASCGLVLDGEQRLALDLMFAERDDDTWAAFEWAVICARQNMKTALLQAAVLGDLFITDARLVIWTAHLFDTAQEAFRDLDALIGSNDDLSRRVRKVSRANGDEGFELKSGARLKFKARSKTGGRGLTGDVVILDEAFALGASEMGALLPTLSARPNPQVRYASSAGLETSGILRGIRDRGRAGDDPSLAYVEWCAPEKSCATTDCSHALGVHGCALDDPEMWRLANPAMDRRITRDHIASERRALSLEPEEFARERLGWWSDPGGADLAYPYNEWSKLAEPASQMTDDYPVFFIDTNPIRSRTAIAVAGLRDDKLHHVEVVQFSDRTGWVASRCADLAEKFPNATFGWLKDGAAASLAAEFERAGVEVHPMDSRGYVAACGSMYDAVVNRSFRHIGQEQLDDAVVNAKKRQLEGAWALARKGGDISPLVAAVCARHMHAARGEAAPVALWL